MSDIFERCDCESLYTIEPHGEGYALYYSRCIHRHGYNLVYLTDPAYNFEPRHIERLLNIGSKEYFKNPNKGHLAE